MPELLPDRFFAWLAGQYDPQSGGFFYARSSPPDFSPDIESTAQAVKILSVCGLIPSLPGEMKRALIAFFQSRQDPQSGLFLDLNPQMRSIERLRGRALSYSLSALKTLGVAPLHPLPGTEETSQSEAEPLRSLENWTKWLEERPWDWSWSAGDHIQSMIALLRLQPEEKQQPLLAATFAFLPRKQNIDTGMWGEGELYVRISAAFKIASFYTAFERPIPCAPQIYATFLKTLREEKVHDLCWVRNPLDLLRQMRPQLPPLPASERAEIIEITRANLALFAQNDGGWSREIGHSPAAPNSVPLSQGLAESDMNASSQVVHLIRPMLLELAEVPPQPPAGAATFSAALQAAIIP